LFTAVYVKKRANTKKFTVNVYAFSYFLRVSLHNALISKVGWDWARIALIALIALVILPTIAGKPLVGDILILINLDELLLESLVTVLATKTSYRRRNEFLATV
jgi:hypothetical protein